MAGLPMIGMTETVEGRYLTIEFVRRIGSGLVYTPKYSASLTAGSWATLTAAPDIVPLDSEWERVTYYEPINPADFPKCFGRVEVTIP